MLKFVANNRIELQFMKRLLAGICALMGVLLVTSMSGIPEASEGGSVKWMTFEEALQKLESIVEGMESGDLPLESLLAKYEEGVKLAKICQDKLAEAELRIQQLEKTAAGELKLKPVAVELSEE